MDRRFDELQARIEAAEGALRTIRARQQSVCLPIVNSADRGLIVAITEILESYGSSFAADAFAVPFWTFR